MKFSYLVDVFWTTILGPEWKELHFAEDIFKCIYQKEITYFANIVPKIRSWESNLQQVRTGSGNGSVLSSRPAITWFYNDNF